MTAARLLMVTQDTSLLQHVREVVGAKPGCQVEHLPDVRYGLDFISRLGAALVIVHVPDGESVERVVHFIDRLVAMPTPVPAIAVLEQASDAATLRLVKAGAIECMPRPINKSRLSLLIDMLTARVRASEPAPVEATPAAEAEDEPLEFALGDDIYLLGSPIMRELAEQVKTVAPLDTTILVSGETGTGKTRLSRLIHQLSPRSAKRFLSVNCGALPPTLIESELFGHVRGAFTSAHSEQKGKFGEVEDGTLLLDDVNCIPLEVQGALLRAVEDRVYEPVGSSATRRVGARMIVTSNVDLKDEVAARKFREDLYYRLNVIAFHLPPLRERREEIPHLTRRFVDWTCRHHNLPSRGLSDAAIETLTNYRWPGNVRELHNVIERAVVMSKDSVIDVRHLPNQVLESIPETPVGPVVMTPTIVERNPLAQARWEAERMALRSALQRNNENRTETANELGISRAALYKKLRKYGIGPNGGA